MRKLPYLPDSDGYSFNDATEAVMVSLDGGPPRVRSDILNGPVSLTANWTLDRTGYDYFRAFYRVVMDREAGKFQCDLIIDDSAITQHDCIFVPGSMKLAQQRGLMYVVAASLVVIPIPMDLDKEEAVLDSVDAYGSEFAAKDIYGLLNELANIRLNQI